MVNEKKRKARVRVFIAAPLESRQSAEALADELRSRGVDVTSTWHLPPVETRPLDREGANRMVERAFTEMDSSDHLVLLAALGEADHWCYASYWSSTRSDPPIVIAQTRTVNPLLATALFRVVRVGDTHHRVVADAVLGSIAA